MLDYQVTFIFYQDSQNFLVKKSLNFCEHLNFSLGLLDDLKEAFHIFSGWLDLTQDGYHAWDFLQKFYSFQINQGSINQEMELIGYTKSNVMKDSHESWVSSYWILYSLLKIYNVIITLMRYLLRKCWLYFLKVVLCWNFFN